MSSVQLSSAPLARPTAPEVGSIREAAVRAAIWTFLGYGGSLALRFFGNLVLAALLYPAAFAVVGLAQIFMNGLQMLSDVGLQTGVIQSKQGDAPQYLNTAWTVQVVRGIVLCLITIAIAWPLSLLYTEPLLARILPVLGIAAAITGFKSTRILTARRHLCLARLTVFDLVARGLSLGVMVTLAVISPSPWVLVWGAVTGALLTVLYSHTLLPGVRNRLTWDHASMADLASLGKWVLLSSALAFVANQCDRLILGRLLDLDALGVLMIAYLLYSIPRELVMSISGSVIFPAAARNSHLPREQLREKMLRNRGLVLVALSISVPLLVASGDWVVQLLYDDRYKQAAWMLPVLSLGLWPRFLDVTINDSLTAIRVLHFNPIGSLCRMVLIAVGVPLSFYYWGVVGAVVVIALGDVPNYVVTCVGLKRHGLLGIGQDISATAIFAVVVTVVLVVRSAVLGTSPFDLASVAHGTRGVVH